MTTPVVAFTLAQLRTDAQVLVGDFQGTRFSSTQLDDAVNFAIQYLCQKMSYTYKEMVIPQNVPTTIPPIGDQSGNTTVAQFSLAGLYPDGVTSYSAMDYIDIRKVRFGYGPLYVNPWVAPRPETVLNRTAMTSEDFYSPDWVARTGIPQRWDLFNGNSIIVFPNIQYQNYSNGYLSVGFTQQPALLSQPTDTVDPRISYQDQQYLKYAAAFWLLSLDNTDTQSLATAKVYMDNFNLFLENV